MGWVNTADVIDRIEDVLEQYLDGEVDYCDTQSNATGDETITTSDVVDRAINSFRDDARGELLTLTITESAGMTQRSTILQANEGSGSGVPRFLQTHHIRIDVKVIENSSTGGLHGAYRISCRVKDAVKLVLAKYSELSIPATATASLVQDTSLTGESVPDPGNGESVTRSLAYEVLTEDVR